MKSLATAMLATMLLCSNAHAEACKKDPVTQLSLCDYGLVSEAKQPGTVTLARRIEINDGWSAPVVNITFQPRGGKPQHFSVRLDEQEHFQAHLPIAGKTPGWLELYGIWTKDSVVALAEFGRTPYRSQGRCDPFAELKPTSAPSQAQYILLAHPKAGHITNELTASWHPLFSAQQALGENDHPLPMKAMTKETYLLDRSAVHLSPYLPHLDPETAKTLTPAERALLGYEEVLLGSYCNSDEACRTAGTCCPMMDAIGTPKQCSPEHFFLARTGVPSHKDLLDERQKHPGCGSFMMSSRPRFFTEKNLVTFGPYRVTVEAGGGANMHTRCSWTTRMLRLYRLEGDIAVPLYSTRELVKYD